MTDPERCEFRLTFKDGRVVVTAPVGDVSEVWINGRRYVDDGICRARSGYVRIIYNDDDAQRDWCHLQRGHDGAHSDGVDRWVRD